MHRRSAFLLSAVLGCHATQRPIVTPAAVEAPATSAGDAPEELTVRAREAPRMPRCSADDALAAGALAEGIAASPALARRDDGGLVAFIQDHDHDGRADLGFLTLDAQGAPAANGNFTLPDAGEDPAFPALVATDTGYLLVWRRGASGHHTLASRSFDAHGAPTGATTALAPQGALGPPSLAWVNGAAVVSVARNASRDGDPQSATHIDLVEGDHPTRTVTAPADTRFSLDAPVLAVTSAGVRAYTMLARATAEAHEERALVRLFDAPDAQPTLIARDMDHPTALSSPNGTLLAWRARIARHDSSVRSVFVPDGAEVGSPPVTLATFRGAFGAEVALAPLGAHRVGALSVTALSDDATGSLNLSLLDDGGEYIGRAPVLTGFLTRSTRLAVASRGADAWIAADGRDTDGSGPELLITHLRCEEGSAVERLDVPPATFVQDLTAPDAAPISLARTPGGGSVAMTCTARGGGAFVTHQADGLSNSSAAVVQVGPNALLLAVAKLDARATSLSYAWVDARGHSAPARRVVDNADEILAAEPVGGAALVVVRYPFHDVGRTDVLTFRGAAVSHGMIPSGMRDPSSAVVVPETGTVFVTARTEAGAPMLFRVATAQGRPGAPVAIAPMRLGDRVVDVFRHGAVSELLLVRPDALDPEVGQTVARMTVRDGATASTRDPFLDPLGHPRGAVQWAHRGANPSVIYAENNILRESDLEAGQLTHARSLLTSLAGGAGILATAWSGGERWLSLATGQAEAGSPHADDTRAITLGVLGADGALRGINTRVPDDPNAADEAAAMSVSGHRVVLLYPRVSGQNAIEWAYSDANCGGE